jgi:hypothetical protein
MSLVYVQSSGFLFHTAQRAAWPAPGSPREPIIAIVFAAMSVEGWINELLESVSHATPEDPVSVRRLQSMSRVADLRGRQSKLTMKVRVIAITLSEIISEADEELYKDLELLFRCRNELAHQRPERIEYDNPRRALHRLTQQLLARQLIETEPHTVQTLMNALCEPKVGEWACLTSKEVMRNIALRLPDGDWRQQQLYRPPLLEGVAVDTKEGELSNPPV